MYRWLAQHRWRLLLSLGCIVALRIIMGVVFIAVDHELWLRLTLVTSCNIAMCVGVVATIVAFVQYGRIFNPRIPTE